MRTLDERKEGVECCRCGEQRFPFRNWSEPYVCGRCLEAIRGGNVRDPAGERSEAQQRAAAQLHKPRSLGEHGGEIQAIGPEEVS